MNLFGKKRPNIDLDQSIDASSKKDDLNISIDQESTKFIFYHKDKTFKGLMEIYVIIKNYNKKFMIPIDNENSLEDLKDSIIKNLKSDPEFKSINKLNIDGLYKIYNNNNISLPLEGKVSEYVNSGDILYCNLFADEFWIKTFFNIRSYNFKKMIKLEYKLKKKMTYKKFKLMLMKGGIQFFLENIKNTEYTDYSYYLKFFEFKIKKYKMIITHNVHNKHKNKMPIDKIINNSSEIIVKLYFGIFEKLIHKNIKLSNIENLNRLRLVEYKDLNFEDLMNEEKFLPEFSAIKEITEDFLNNQKNINNPNFLFYSKKKVKFKGASSKKNFHFFDEPKPIEEIKEENEDKDDNAPRLFDTEKDELLNIKTNKLVKSSQIKIIDNDIANIKINNIIKDKNNDIITTANNKIKRKKIKNMIIITKQLIQAEKKKKKFVRLVTQSNINKKNDISTNVPKLNPRSSVSNKNLITYDNYNFNKFIDKKEDSKKPIRGNNSQDMTSDYYITTSIENKQNSLLEKNNIFNFGESKKSSKEGLNELLLDDQNDKNILKDKYHTTMSSKNQREIKGNFFFNNPANTEPYCDEGTSSQFEEDMKSDLKTQVFPRRKEEKAPTYKYNTKLAFLSVFKNRQKKTDLVEDLKSDFKSDKFIAEISDIFNNLCDKNTFDKIKMPQRKEIEYLDKEHNFSINQKRERQFNDILLGNRFHIRIFLILLLIFLVLILLFINLDVLSIYLDI